MRRQRVVSRRSFLAFGGAVAGASCVFGLSGLARAAGSAAFDFYISPDGNDSNPGTQSAPWAITALNSKRAIYAGKRVGLLDGTYNVYPLAYPYIAGETPFLNVAGGLGASTPTVVEAVNPRRAVIDGSNGGKLLVDATRGGGGIIGAVGADRSNIQLRNLVIRNNYGAAVQFGYWASDGYVSGPRTTGIVLDGCEIYGTNSITDGTIRGFNCGAVSLMHVTAVVRNCYIHDAYGETLAKADHTAGIIAFDNVNSVYEYNTFKNVACAIRWKGGANARSTVRFNYVELDARNNICLSMDHHSAGAGESVIHNNVFVGNGTINFDVESFEVNPVHFFNNTCITGPYSGVSHFQASRDARFLHLYNNIFSRPGSIAGGDVQVTSDTWATLDHNCYPASGFRNLAFDVNSTSNYAAYTSLAAWVARVNSSLAGGESHSIQADPRFVNQGADADRYKLASTSPCSTAASDGGQMGAWGGGATKIGSYFGEGPTPPSLISVS